LSDGNCLVEGATVEYELQFDDKKQKQRAVNVTGCSTDAGRSATGAAVGAYGGAAAAGYGAPGPYGMQAYGMYGPPGAYYGQGYGDYSQFAGGYDYYGQQAYAGYQNPYGGGGAYGGGGKPPGMGGGAGPQNPLYKTRMCQVVGTCRFGDRCNFAHDQSELRKLERGAPGGAGGGFAAAGM